MNAASAHGHHSTLWYWMGGSCDCHVTGPQEQVEAAGGGQRETCEPGRVTVMHQCRTGAIFFGRRAGSWRSKSLIGGRSQVGGV